MMSFMQKNHELSPFDGGQFWIDNTFQWMKFP